MDSEIRYYYESWYNILNNLSNVTEAIIVNMRMATFIEDIKGFEPELSQNLNNESPTRIYTIGKISGLKIKVDPTRAWDNLNIETEGAKVPEII